MGRNITLRAGQQPDAGTAGVTLSYQEFLAAKVATVPRIGFDIELDAVSPICKEHQRIIIKWMVAGGRRACFASFGLGKTVIQLEACRLILERVGGRGLIVMPLGVRQEFIRDAAMLGTPVTFVQRVAELHPTGIHLTNYETIREGKLDPTDFGVVLLDEGDMLRTFGSKTFSEVVITGGWHEVPYRFVASATPDPNDYLELLGYAQFLGVMDIGQAKTRFFKRNSEQADELTLHPHKEEEFWLWVASWALVIQRPSDLGCSDEGYDLPPMTVNWHEVPSDHAGAGAEKTGQARMFRSAAHGITDAAREKRESLKARIERLVSIVRSQRVPAEVACEEPRAAARARTALVSEEQEAEAGVVARVEESESRQPAHVGCEVLCAEPPEDQSAQRGVVSCESGPGAETNPTSEAGAVRPDAANPRGAGAQAEGKVSHLSAEDEAPGGRPLPSAECGARDPLSPMQRGAGTLSRQPRGAAAREGLPDQIVAWCDLNDEQRAIEKGLAAEGISFSSVFGTLSVEEKERRLTGWRQHDTSTLITKPVLFGCGVNLQQCHTAIFAGINYKFRDFIQAIHRIQRFGQEHPCAIHIIYTEAERPVKAELLAKWERYNRQTARLSTLIREYGLAEIAIASVLTRSIGVERREVRGRGYTLIQNDCVEETRTMADDSIDLQFTSIPFSNQYEYTPSYNDFGHTDNAEHFWQQQDYLTPELYRTLRPGRDLVIHVKDRVQPGAMTGLGFATVQPFHCDAIAHYTRHGFAFLGMITIATDVVRENAQTYRLGYTEKCKDGSRMGAGLPEYLLLFRKPPSDRSNGYADTPVVHEKPKYRRGRWQIDAAGYWRSKGDRLLTPPEIAKLDWDQMYGLFRDYSERTVYDYGHHVALNQALEDAGSLSPEFALLPVASWHPQVWADVTRMRSVNGLQARHGKEKHICPLPFDIVERVIEQRTNPGEVVYDPFGGLFTVPYVAIQLGRHGIACELNPRYFVDGAGHCHAAEEKLSTPTLFDVIGAPIEDVA